MKRYYDFNGKPEEATHPKKVNELLSTWGLNAQRIQTPCGDVLDVTKRWVALLRFVQQIED
jgi:hypothetical protein